MNELLASIRANIVTMAIRYQAYIELKSYLLYTDLSRVTEEMLVFSVQK